MRVLNINKYLRKILVQVLQNVKEIMSFWCFRATESLTNILRVTKNILLAVL